MADALAPASRRPRRASARARARRTRRRRCRVSANQRAVASWWSLRCSPSAARRGMTSTGVPSSSALRIVPMPACATTTFASRMRSRHSAGEMKLRDSMWRGAKLRGTDLREHVAPGAARPPSRPRAADETIERQLVPTVTKITALTPRRSHDPLARCGHWVRHRSAFSLASRPESDSSSTFATLSIQTVRAPKSCAADGEVAGRRRRSRSRSPGVRAAAPSRSGAR